MLEEYGHIPFPPYVTESEAEEDRYQTVYADKQGSVAAPTAGLHFTPELFHKLAQKGIDTAYITLHVGVGTFRPVEVENITEHLMHQEFLEISAETAEKIAQTKARGGRVIAVGTTVARALEGAIKETKSDKLTAFQGKTNLFVYPGYQWRVIDGMITNFHLPKSSLMMLVSALVGRERLLALYQAAIQERFRFYSFGDAMLILPSARSSNR
jgi:S-adenosylmethionine:tRNA ribosyltransferase-isomerase